MAERGLLDHQGHHEPPQASLLESWSLRLLGYVMVSGRRTACYGLRSYGISMETNNGSS
jgi:hypothetical protein